MEMYGTVGERERKRLKEKEKEGGSEREREAQYGRAPSHPLTDP